MPSTFYQNNEPGLLNTGLKVKLSNLDTTGASTNNVIKFNGTDVIWGSGGAGGDMQIGNPVIDGTPDSILYIDNLGDLAQDSLFTRDSTTNFTNIERDFNSELTEYTADLLDIVLLGNIVGSGFQVGETLNNLTSGGTATVAFVGNPGGDLLYLSNITGTFTYLDNVVGVTSGTVADVAVLFPISFSNGETIYFFDTIAQTPTGVGLISNIAGNTITFTVSAGTVVNDYAILDIPFGPTTVAGISNLQSSIMNIPMTTGFITDNNYGGAGLDASYMHIEDNSTGDSIDFGVFDLTPFGGLRTTAGIVSLDLMSGAATTFVVNPAGAFGNIQSNVTNANTDSSTINIGATGISAITRLNPGQDTGFETNGTFATFLAGGYRFHMPTGTDTTGYVLGIQSQTGNDVYFGFQAPGGGGGGSSYGPNNTIQISDGGGNFTGNSSFGYDYLTNIPQFVCNNGLRIDPSNNIYEIGDFSNAGNDAFWYIDTQYGSNQMFYQNTTHSVSTPIFTGTGVDNLTLSGTPTGSTANYTVTIDSQLQYGGNMFSGTGLDDGTFSGGYAGVGNQKLKVVIDSTPVFSGVTFTGAGLDDITEAVSPYFTGPLPTTYTLTITENNVKLLNYDTLAGGTFSDGDTITGLSSATVATIIYQAGGALYYQVTSGTDFSVAETIDNGLGVTANVVSVAGIDADVFEWTDGVVTNKQWMLPSFYMSLNYGVSVTFASTTGHTIGDSWSFDYTAPVTDTFEWFLNGVSQASGVAITGTAQSLGGIQSITFTSTSGHTTGDMWDKIVGYGYMDYATTAETGSNMQQGETVTGSISGAQAIVGYSDPFSFHAIGLTNQSGFFVTGDVLTGSITGYTATITNYTMTGVGDTFTWTDGTTTQTNKPVSTNVSFQSNQGVLFNWATATGHDVGDFWTFTMTAASRRKFQIAGNTIQIGDAEGAFNFDRLIIDVGSGNSYIDASSSFEFHNSAPMQGGRPILAINMGTTNTVGIGDFNGSHEGFYSLFDIPNKSFKMFQGGAGGYKRVEFDTGNNFYQLGLPANNESYFVIDGPNNNTALHAYGQITLGDVLEGANKTQLLVNDTTQIIKTKSDGNDRTTMVGAPKLLTNTSATQVFKISLPADTATGGFFTANVTANDGTDYQAHSDHVTYAAVNKGGVYTTDITSSNAGDSIATSTGTLAVTWSITTGTNEIIIECTANSSLTAPTVELFYNVISNGVGTITPL